MAHDHSVDEGSRMDRALPSQGGHPSAQLEAARTALSNSVIPALQLATLAEIGSKVAGARSVEDILRVVTAEARWLIDFDRCSLALVTPGGRSLRVYTLTGAGRDTCSTQTRSLDHGLLGRALRHGQPLNLRDPEAESGPHAPDDLAIVPDAHSALVLPLATDGDLFGTLNFSSVRQDAYSQSALSIVRLLALQVSTSVRNALLLDELDSSENVIVSLALAIEAKDPYTEGHCRRLALYAERLGKAIGLPPENLKTLRMAAILHDVGKIAVPESVLNKPGPLTPAEYSAMQAHPVVGENICRPLRSARSILPAIRHHHERWDGNGYPDGLAGTSIPLDARIIAIVDAYDAMTSDRPYRPGFPVRRALEIMNENSGPQWDPQLLEVFTSIVGEPPKADADLVHAAGVA